MTEFFFEPVYHKNEERIALRCPNEACINKVVRTLASVRWSKTLRCWHIAMDEKICRNALQLLSSLGSINTSILSTYLQKRKAGEAANPGKRAGTLTARQIITIQKISIHNLEQLRLMTERLRLKAYSSSTQRTYRAEMLAYLQAIGNLEADKVTIAAVKEYLIGCMDRGLTEHTIHSRMNALKFYYEQVLGQGKFFLEIPRPKKPMQLPKLLNENEIARLFNALSNRKHKALLFTCYSAGLRVSEVVNLKIADIDSTRMQIFVERAKGKKDRYVNLSPVLLDVLRSYISKCEPRPQRYLFESEQTHTAYPTRTVQQIFANAKQFAGIKKEVGIHSLRHSFATHLLDKGTDIRYIKELLGHFNIRTTERYLHVSKQQLVNIISPFDDLWKRGDVEW